MKKLHELKRSLEERNKRDIETTQRQMKEVQALSKETDLIEQSNGLEIDFVGF